ncbi:MAG TPA: Fe-S cluster assembly protein SufD [Myxococcota bacterium]|jgi:Fe-S cluster assembly protein SufD
MSALEAARDHFVASARAFAAAADPRDPAWLRSLRAEAAASFAEQGLPTTRLEEWRYTNLTPLAKTRFELPGAEPAAVDREAVEAVCFPVFACSVFVFVDGRFRPELSSPRALSGNLRVESLAELRTRAPARLAGQLGRLADPKRHPFVALGTACLDDGACLFVPRATRVEQPIHVVQIASGAAPDRVCHPRLLLVAEPGSQVTVIQDFVSLAGARGFSNAVAEVSVGQGAAVDLVLLQRENAESFHVSNLEVRIARDARFAAHTLTLGGGFVRNDLNAVLEEEGASLRLDGLTVAGGSSLVDNHTVVDHALPHGESRQRYKCVLGGRARGVFRGRVVVRPDAQKTNASQSSANILLSEGAEIDAKPQLEIWADDVKCSHGATIGRLDENALFYLRSRGIGEAAARDLLVQGFAAELLASLPSPALAEGLTELLREQMRRAGAGEAA